MTIKRELLGLLGCLVLLATARGSARTLESSLPSLVSRDMLRFPSLDVYDHIVGRAESDSKKSIGEIPVKELFSHEFRRRLGLVDDEMLADYKSIFARANLPSDLGAEELRLFLADPERRLCSPLRAVDLPFSYGTHSLDKFYGIFFVVDAVRQLKTEGKIMKRGAVVEFRAAIERYLGRSLDTFDLDRDGHFVDPTAAAPPSVVVEIESGCVVPLSDVPSKELLRELLSRDEAKPR